MQWFRFYHEVLDDPKVQRLPADLFKCWVNLLCLAGKTDKDGLLPPLEDIAFALREGSDEISSSIAKLQDHGLLDATPQGLVIHNWGERQKRSDNTAKRVQQHRQRQRETAPKRPDPQFRKHSRNDDVTLHETAVKRNGNALDKNRVEESKSREETTVSFAADAAQNCPDVVPTPPNPEAIHAVPKVKSREPDPIWDALVEVTGVTPQTKNEQSKYGMAARDLKAIGATAEDILRRGKVYQEHWPGIDLTVTALLEHWSRMANAPPALKSPSGRLSQAEINAGGRGKFVP